MHWSKRLKNENAELRKENAELKTEIEALRSVDLAEMRTPSESNNTIEVTDANFQATVLDADIPFVVKFGADWCGPCRRLDPILDAIAAEDTGYDVGKLNVDQSPRSTGRYGIRSLPTMIVFKGGKEIGRLVGGMPKAYLTQEINRILN